STTPSSASGSSSTPAPSCARSPSRRSPATASSSSPRTTADETARGMLPRETSSLVGREAEVQALERLYAEGARLVTVLGPPGTGKTRLALRQATRAQAVAAGKQAGPVWVDLAAARTADEICAATGEALGVPLTATSGGTGAGAGAGAGARGS